MIVDSSFFTLPINRYWYYKNINMVLFYINKYYVSLSNKAIQFDININNKAKVEKHKCRLDLTSTLVELIFNRL